MEAKGSLQRFYVGYREDGWGRAPYHPRMLVKVLVYVYPPLSNSRRDRSCSC